MPTGSFGRRTELLRGDCRELAHRPRAWLRRESRGQLGQSGWIDFLMAQGRAVVGLDCRGYGRSGKPHDPGAYDHNQMADDVIAVMDAAALDRADVMGYFVGGRIAISFLARFPDRISRVRSSCATIGDGAKAGTARRMADWHHRCWLPRG
jgi:pimeloyl-ACP methyl ester carboxylesterase